MRDSKGRKLGALTLEQCRLKATELIAEHGVCLFIVDLVHSTELSGATRDRTYELFAQFQRRANELFIGSMPRNSLASLDREEQGFTPGLGDAAWTAIDDPALVDSIAELHRKEFPELQLHYGVAADGWSSGIEIIR